MFRGGRPMPIVNPEVWPAYVVRHKDIVGEKPIG